MFATITDYELICIAGIHHAEGRHAAAMAGLAVHLMQEDQTVSLADVDVSVDIVTPRQDSASSSNIGVVALAALGTVAGLALISLSVIKCRSRSHARTQTPATVRLAVARTRYFTIIYRRPLEFAMLSLLCHVAISTRVYQ